VDPLWFLVAFICGFLVRQVGLPPLLGFLCAGFVLQAAGVEGGAILQKLADMGVVLLLFSIGLKMKVKSLLKPEVWAGAAVHMSVTVIVFGAGIYLLSLAGFSLFAGLDFKLALLVAFALSFSSTVFAVKILEEKGEMSSKHGQVSIGILIMQDIFAVVFLVFTAGKMPSIWAFALFGLVLVRPLIFFIIERSGHGELLVLLGWLLPVAGMAIFELVNLKPDLGALVLGMLLADHPKANELAKALLSFKDLFLVGFFLTIGLSGAPSVESLGIAVLLVAAVPFKVALFLWLLTRLKLRARTATLASLSLANYSEFGLIVGAVGVSNGWISGEWLVILAIALSISFVVASPLNTAAQQLYDRWHDRLVHLETGERLPGDGYIDPGEAEMGVIGMGRIGARVYDRLAEHSGHPIIGLDHNEEVVSQNVEAGRNVILGDATDSDFWSRVQARGTLSLIVLAMADHAANLYMVRQFRAQNLGMTIAATAQFDDQMRELQEAGASVVFNFYEEAGAGFAEEICRKLKST